MAVRGRDRTLAAAGVLRGRVAALPSRRTLADEVATLLARELVLDDAVPVGTLLPGEIELAQRYGVSRATVRSSLRLLRDAGLIGVRQGVGAVVLARPDATRFGVDRLCSLETFAREAGRAIDERALEIEELVADEQLAAGLGIAVGDPMAVVQRVLVEDGAPVAWLSDYVPADVLTVQQLRSELDGSVLDVLLAHAAVDHAESEIEPVAFPKDVAARLEVASGTLGLRLTETLRTSDGRGLTRSIGWYRHPQAFGRMCVRRRPRVGD